MPFVGMTSFGSWAGDEGLVRSGCQLLEGHIAAVTCFLSRCCLYNTKNYLNFIGGEGVALGARAHPATPGC